MNTKLCKFILLGIMVVMTVTACGSKNSDSQMVEGSNEEVTVDDLVEEKTVVDIDVKAFAQSLAEKRTDIAFVEMTEGYVQGVMDFDVTKAESYSVYVDASGATVDEYDIFKANEGSDEEVEAMILEYLEMRLDTWMDEYMPEEKPKVERAEVKNIGSYYIYAILSGDEKEQVFMEFENALIK